MHSLSSAASVVAPSNVRATISGSSLTLSWDVSGNPSGVMLYYGNSTGLYINENSGVDLGNSTSRTFNNIPQGTYYIALKSYDSSGALSGYSTEVSIVVGIAAPSNLTSTVNGSSVTISWTASAGATGYKLYYGTTSTNYVNSANGLDIGNSLSSTFYNIPSGTYYIALKSYDNSGNSSDISSETIATVAAENITIELPINLSDSASTVYSLWPYGIHGSVHSYDGHPGIDIEYTPGSSVMAAYSGTINSIFDESSSSNTKTVSINHTVGSKTWRTTYTNIESLSNGIANGAQVATGQVIGVAGSVTQYVGSSLVTFAMTHFQLDDFSQSYGLSNVSAVSPEYYLSASGRTILNSIWQHAAYRQEICEPYITNSRGTTPYPEIVRTWTKVSGSHSAQIVFTCVTSGNGSVSYSLNDDTGSVIESGAVTVNNATSSFSSLDFQPSSGGSSKLAVYTILNGSMSIDYRGAGESRPSDLSNVSVYTTN
ncbi:MAG: peptidoglycan DD-metalloendopeptidase family protein [Nitrospinae bacterium]|nr:peptidoglycan DD-metalloendopeptidase family protein [Nitrospinota bacterium]